MTAALVILAAYLATAVVIGATWAVGCWLLDADEMDAEFWRVLVWRAATWPVRWRW